MKFYNRILSSFFAVVIMVSVICTPYAHAALINDVAYYYTTSSWAPFVMSASLQGLGFVGDLYFPEFPGIGTFLAGVADKGINNLAEYYAAGYTDDDYYAAEVDYLTTLDSTTITNADTGFSPAMHYSALEDGSFSLSAVTILDYTSGPPFHLSVEFSGGSKDYIYLYSDEFSVPTSGYYRVSSLCSYFGVAFDSEFVELQVLNNGSWVRVGRVSSLLDDSVTLVDGLDYKTAEFYNSSLYLYADNTYRLYDQLRYYMVSPEYYGYPFSYDLNVTLSLKGTTVVPASTRPSGLSTVINDYNTQNINTGGNYTNYYIGTVDVNGDVVDIYDFDIFDESTMTITNPASGDTWTATAWEYDYETRSYYCTLEDDQYCRITYGDEYVTIIYPDEDGVYHEQYYYYVTAEYTATSGTTCDHVYTSETTTLSTCTESGWRTYTCALCGYSYETSVAATGHTWEETETVETEYNDNGDVTKLGYTVYTCSVCEETYKAYSQDGQPTGPPSSSGTSSGSGSTSNGTGIWDSIKSIVSDAIEAVVKAAMDVITTVINGILSLATDMLSFVFDLFSDAVTSGAKNFFSVFSDNSITGFFQQESEDGTTTTTLPENVAAGMATVSGFFGGLPAPLRAVLIYGIALLFLLAALKIVL